MEGTADVAVTPHRLVGEGEVGGGSACSWTPFPRGKFHCLVLPLRGEGVMAEREGNHVQRGNQGATEKARQDWGSLPPPSHTSLDLHPRTHTPGTVPGAGVIREQNRWKSLSS